MWWKHVRNSYVLRKDETVHENLLSDSRNASRVLFN